MTGVVVKSALAQSANRLRQDLARGSYVKTLLGAGEVVASEIRKAIAGWGDAPSGLGRKTGALARSFVPALLQQGEEKFTIGVYSPLPYAGIQDTGGVVKATNARFLAIPLTPMARRFAPREFPGGLVAIGKGGRGVLVSRAEVKNKRGGTRMRETAQYALKSSVTLPGHEYLKTAEASAMPKVTAYIQASLTRVLKGTLEKAP